MADLDRTLHSRYQTHIVWEQRSNGISLVAARAWASLRTISDLGSELARNFSRLFWDTRDGLAFRRFWGEGLRSSNAYFVIDSYEDVRLRSGFRRLETLSSAVPSDRLASPEIINGTFAPQAAAMLTALFLRHTGRVLRIATDTELSQELDATLICYGTADSNFKTFDVEASSEKNLCQFSFSGDGQRAFRVGDQLHSVEERDGQTFDKAVIFRLTNRHGRGNSQVVCAGLTEWGCLASVHYLTKKWKTLHKRFDDLGRRWDFCVLLEVPCGQFESYKELASAVWWEPKARKARRWNEGERRSNSPVPPSHGASLGDGR